VTVVADLGTVERIKYAVMAVYERYGVLTDATMQAQLLGAIAEALMLIEAERGEERQYPHSKVEKVLRLLDEEYEKSHAVFRVSGDSYANGSSSALDLAERIVMEVFEIQPAPPQQQIFTGNNPELWQ
jgi:hypothetical protein